MRKSRLFLLVGVILLSLTSAVADTVTPTNEVVTRVVIRSNTSTGSADIGSLRSGDEAELIDSVPNWYRIRLPNGTEGYVAKRWTRVNSSTGTASYTLDVIDVGTGL